MYLVSRGKLFWFSRKLPDLAGQFLLLQSGARKVGANGYLRFSLETGNRREAEKLARRYAVDADNALDALAKRQDNAGQAITPEDISYAAEIMRVSLLESDETFRHSLVNAQLKGEAPELDPEDFTYEKLPPPGTAGDVELLKRLRDTIPLFLLTQLGKLPSGPVDASYMPFVAAYRDAFAILAQRAQGKTLPTPEAPPKPKSLGGGFGWDDMLAYYWQHHQTVSDSTRSLYRLVIGRLAKHCGVQPRHLTRAQVIAWRDSITQTLAPKTAYTHLTAAGTVYRYALNCEKLGERADPFRAVTVPDGKNAESSREKFELTTLKEIFRDPPELEDIPEAAGAHAAYWVPILALYTGARKEELTGLLLDEVIIERGQVTLLMRNNRLRNLKTKNSKRDVPVHKDVLALGFIEYIDTLRQAGADRLFPGVVNSESVADWFIPHVQSRIGKGETKQDLHSFRHTFKTACRTAEMLTEMHEFLTGHARSSVSDKYGTPAGQQTVRRALNRVKYPGVVLTPPPKATVAQIAEITKRAERRRKAGEARSRGIQRAKQAASARKIGTG